MSATPRLFVEIDLAPAATVGLDDGLITILMKGLASGFMKGLMSGLTDNTPCRS